MANITVNSLGLADGVNGNVVELSCLNGELVMSPFVAQNSTNQPSVVTFVDEISSESLIKYVTDNAITLLTIDDSYIVSNLVKETGDYLVDYTFVGEFAGFTFDGLDLVETIISASKTFMSYNFKRILSISNIATPTVLLYSSETSATTLVSNKESTGVDYLTITTTDGKKVNFKVTLKTGISKDVLVKLIGKRVLKLTKLA
jgi:hypothetical protein